MWKPVLLTIVTLITIFAAALPASADGIIIPEPPICDPGPCPEPVPITQLAIEYHRVQVSIEDQVAVTHVDQVFRNDNDWPVEGIYVFPLPAEAAVTEFTLWIDDEPVEGKVLSKEEARRTYEQIVRKMRDPALLEYVDRGAVQASVFPIPAGGRRRIELEYTQILQADQGLIHFSYPLNTEKFSTQPLEDVSVSVRVDSPDPVRAVYSPSHPVAISKQDDHHFTVGYEDTDVTPDKDFELYYSITAQDIGVNLITFRDPQAQDKDGYFLLLAAPSVEVDPDRRIAKDIFLVLDQSGSMDGEKFRQAQTAAKYVLDNLNPEDRFNVIAFSTGTRAFAGDLRTTELVPEAKRWVDTLAAAGSTDINLALLEALAQTDHERATILIFLTDGLPTEGVTESEAILDNIAQSASDNVSIFAFGVGYDVDTFLLDSLARHHHGAASYVTQDQAIDEVVSGFYAKVSTPVLVDLEIDFGDALAYDHYPSPLPDLFAGGQLVLVGRYRDPGRADLELSGWVEGDLQRFDYPEQRFRRSGGSDFLPRLWATRKIGALLNQVRLEGPEKELVDQIVKLSIRYGIVTPYTSYLVTEPEPLSQDVQDDIVEEAYEKLLDAPFAASGEAAVERAEAESEIRDAEVAPELSGSAAEQVKIVGARTFRRVDGVWIDTAFDAERMQAIRVPFLSDDYFELVSARSDLGDAFALGAHVIAVAGGNAYEIIAEDEIGDELVLPAPLEEGTPTGETETSTSALSPNQREGERTSPPSALNLPCPGAAVLLGLAGLARVKRRAEKLKINVP
jgi:Ca-activated chloride channel family protein